MKYNMINSSKMKAMQDCMAFINYIGPTRCQHIPGQVMIHATCFDWVFSMGPLLCDISLRKNIINHLYKNLSNSIYNIFILQAKWYPQTMDVNPGTLLTRTLPNANSIHRHFAHKELCPQQSDRVGCSATVKIFLTTLTFSLSINQLINRTILHLDNYSGYSVETEKH